MEINPQPDDPTLFQRFQLLTVAISDPKQRRKVIIEAEKLYNTLLAGEIPDGPPNLPLRHGKTSFQDGFAHLIVREIPVWFRMFAFLHMKFLRPLAKALNEELGAATTYLELLAGKGWLAKGLKQAGLQGHYIATDKSPGKDTVYPVIKMDAISAVKQFRDETDVYILSWPPMADFVTKCLDEMPTGAVILYMGEPGGCCGTPEFFARTEVIDFNSEVTSKYWKVAQQNYFRWGGMNDRLQLRVKTD